MNIHAMFGEMEIIDYSVKRPGFFHVALQS